MYRHNPELEIGQLVMEQVSGVLVKYLLDRCCHRGGASVNKLDAQLLTMDGLVDHGEDSIIEEENINVWYLCCFLLLELGMVEVG